MKKISGIFLAALLTALLAVSVFASDIIFVDYATGNDTNDGETMSTAKKTTPAAATALPNGGTMVVFGKGYMHTKTTFEKTAEPITITSVYGGRDYKNPEPAENPACAFKAGSGVVWTVAGDVILDDIILFQENNQNTIVVADGGSLTVNENVICMSKRDYYWNIKVEAGGKTVINGGIFSNITGAGDIEIGENVTVLNASHSGPQKGDPEAVFHKYGASNENSGLTPDAPKSSLGSLSENGAISLLPRGGTLVGIGKLYLGRSYTLPRLAGPLTLTSVWGGVDYRNPEPAENPACAFKMASGATFTIQSDVIFDNIILFQENEQNTISVKAGATLTVTDRVTFQTKPGNDYHYRIVLEEGATAILTEEAQKVFTVENNGGDVLTYGAATDTTVVKMTVGKLTGYVDGRGRVLDAAPVIRNSRTMLPVRFVAESLGATVGWDGATSTVTVSTDTVEIRITIGKAEATVNGAAVTLDSPAFIENSRTYLPVRFVAENLGATVGWDGATSTVTLTK